MLGVKNIVEGTVSLLWHCDKLKVKKFVFVSSSMIYGNFSDGAKEDADSKPNNLYGEMQLDDNKFSVEPGDIVLIKDGVFHKVYNPGDEEELYFVCVLHGARHK